jgi:MFS family permease
LRARNPRLALATVITEGFLGRLTFGMVSFALPLYAHELGLSLAAIGLLVSLRTVVVLPLKPVAGWLADRVGVRNVYLLGIFARTISAAMLLITGGFVGLMAVRLLQGMSAAGRDVASLGVIAREAASRVGTAYGSYASAKHVGGVAGAGVAGFVIAASGGTYRTLFILVLAMSLVPLAAAWVGLREEPELGPASESERETAQDAQVSLEAVSVGKGRPSDTVSLLRELTGPASVGMLVATSAYMVHGIFPILATQYAGLSEAEAGLIYSLSAAFFLIGGPTFGWLVDRYGRLLGIAWRSAANIGSSLMYLAFPNFLGLAAARSFDDSGKGAFRPAWASTIASIAAKDPQKSGRRLGMLDTSQSIGEAIGPALAGILWQSGGVVLLFGVRMAIALVAELLALRVFGELRSWNSQNYKGAAYLTPPALALAAAAIWMGYTSRWGASPTPPADLILGGGVILLGLLAGALAGRAAAAAERRAAHSEREEALRSLSHDLRGPLTIIRGEAELVLIREDAGATDRRRSSARIIEEVERIERIIRQQRQQ